MSEHHRKHPDKESREEGPAGKVLRPEEKGAGSNGEEAVEKVLSVTIPVQEYESLMAVVEEIKDRYLRTAADFDNFRKRAEKEKESIICYANEKLISDLLPILDNLERALAADRNGTSVEGILEGVHLVRKQLHSVLTACGLEPVEAVGTPFDPLVHEAVGVLPSEKHEEGTVVSELQRGYRLKGKVLRHSMVHVGAGRAGGGVRGEEEER